MEKMYRMLAAVTLLFATSSSPASEVIETWKLELDESRLLKVSGEFYTVKVIEINDSRCPTDVFCFWQGEARVLIDVRSFTTAEVSSYDLKLEDESTAQGEDKQDIINLANARIRLSGVTPYPVSAVSGEQAADETPSVVELEITREAVDCRHSVPQFCTLEYAPVDCEYLGANIFGSNFCDARRQAQMMACRAAIPFSAASLSCQSSN